MCSRYTADSATVAYLPDIDMLVLSHSHYNHIDCNALMNLVARFPDLPAYPALGNQLFLKSVGLKHITVPDWWEEFQPTVAHCPAFAQISEAYGTFDLAAIAIDAYGPERLFGGMYANPKLAVRITEIRSKKSIGIHRGTFILTVEPIDEPPKRLETEMKPRGREPAEFSVLAIGGTTTG
ncbi:Protein-lysine N-methyltransferase efm4 [Coemansia sp. RSA 988]|nr:Protein-lysine N-methyltransferase efm4 [Coemansia sp. RSA 988]